MSVPSPNNNALPWWLIAGAALPGIDLLLLGLDVGSASGWRPVLHGAALVSALSTGALLWRGWRRCQRRMAQLEDGIAALDEGFALFDAEDRLVLINEAYRRLYPKRSQAWQPGDHFEDMVRSAVEAGEVKAAIGQEAEWVRQRMAMHREPGPPWLQALADGRWLRVHERRTPSGAQVGLRADVSELVHTQEALGLAQAQAQHDRQLLERAVDAMPIGIEIYDEQDRLLLANRRILEWHPHHDLVQARGQTFETLLQRSRASGALPLEALGREEEWMAERIARRGRSETPLLQQLREGRWLMIYETRTPEGYLVSVRQDVSELIAKERALQSSQAQLQAIIGTAGVAIITLDEQGLVRSANPATERMLGHPIDALLGQDVALLMDAPTRAEVAQFMRIYLLRLNRGLLGQQREIPVLHRSGRELTVQLALAEVISGDEHLFVAVLTDITERKRFELELQHANEQLLRLSTTDALTELANRRLLMQRLEDEWRRALRSRERLSLLLIDVDFFKLYNDHYGHQAGDVCLQAVARVLASCASRPSDLAARYGGEEFVLLLPQTDAEGAHAVAQRVCQCMREAALAHELSPLGPHLSLSIGLVSGLPVPEGSAAQWLAQADLALYQAKAQGRNRVVQAPSY